MRKTRLQSGRLAAAGASALSWVALLYRGIWWRLGGSAALFAVGLIALGSAAAGPIYLQSASDAMLHSVLRAAPADSSGVILSPYTNPADMAAVLPSAEERLPRARQWFGPPITTFDVTSDLGSAWQAEVVSRTGVCGQLRLTAGHCPAGPGQALISSRSAAAVGVGSARASRWLRSAGTDRCGCK